MALQLETTLPDVKPAQETAIEPIPVLDEEPALEPRYRVLIHNDPVTTFEYVIQILGDLFFLSGELAEHVAWTAHTNGDAVVVIRSRKEAETLARAANGRARADGFPLTFTTEPDE